jgi:hypothetical protein
VSNYDVSNQDEFFALLKSAFSNKDIQQVNNLMEQATDTLLLSVVLPQLYRLYNTEYGKEILYALLNKIPAKKEDLNFQLMSLLIISFHQSSYDVAYQTWIRDILHYIPKEQRLLTTNQWNLFRDPPPNTNLARILFDAIGYADTTNNEFSHVFNLILAAANKLSIESIADSRRKGWMIVSAKPKKHIPDFIRNGIPRLTDQNVAVLNQTINEFNDYLKTHSPQEADDFNIVEKSMSDEGEPTFIPWGKGEHAIGLVKYKDYLIVSDRRAGRHIHENSYIGTTVYKLTSWPGELLQNDFEVDVFNQHLKKIVDPIPVAEFVETAQKRGTCSFSNYKAVIKGLLVLESQLKHDADKAVPTRSVSKEIYDKATQLYKKYTSHYRDREVEKLIGLYNNPATSRLAHEQIFSAFYDYITGHCFLNQRKDMQRITKILHETDILTLTTENMLKYEIDILLLFQVCKYINDENALKKIRDTFLACSPDDKLKIILNSENILTDQLDELRDLQRDDPTLVASLKETPWFIATAYDALKEAMINQNDASFNRIIDFLQSLDDNQTLNLVNNHQAESLLDLSIILKQPSFEARLHNGQHSIIDAPLSAEDCQHKIKSLINAEYDYTQGGLIKHYLRIAMNSFDSPNERLAFLAADNFALFKFILASHQELIDFYVNEIAQCGATPSQLKQVIEQSDIIDVLENGYYKIAVTLKNMTITTPENTPATPQKGLFWSANETVPLILSNSQGSDAEYFSCNEEFDEELTEDKKPYLSPP